MSLQIRQLITAEGWFAVYARASGPVRDLATTTRPSIGAMGRVSGPVPEFVPLVAWALVADEADAAGAEQIVGVLVHDNLSPELVLPDDPSFLGYAGPGDPGVDRVGLTPDWRALAKQAISQLKSARQLP